MDQYLHIDTTANACILYTVYIYIIYICMIQCYIEIVFVNAYSCRLYVIPVMAGREKQRSSCAFDH